MRHLCIYHITYGAPTYHSVQFQQFLRALPVEGAKGGNGGNDVACVGTIHLACADYSTSILFLWASTVVRRIKNKFHKGLPCL